MPSRETHWGQQIAAVALLGALGAGGAAIGRMFSRFVVAGQSMRPTLEPDDRLVVGPLGRLRPGDVVIVLDPRRPDRQMAKRVAALPGETLLVEGAEITAGSDQIVVLGDNPDASTDSREFGPVPLDLVTGRAWYRYAPPGRAGWL